MTCLWEGLFFSWAFRVEAFAGLLDDFLCPLGRGDFLGGCGAAFRGLASDFFGELADRFGSEPIMVSSVVSRVGGF